MAVTIHTADRVGVKVSRVPSTIQFPYTDVSDGISVAECYLKAGGVPLSRDQLASALGLAAGGGGFATKVATARTFGIIDSVGGKYALTPLGHEIVDPARRSAAMADAFLNVELYKKVYDEFRGKRLPPRPHGIEAAFVSLGVSPKNAKAARLAFDKSARVAGFFPNGDEDRLVLPILAERPAEADRGVVSDSALGVSPPPPPASPAPAAAKALEYQLVDLLTLEGMGEAESEAVWTLVRFLTARKKDA